MFNNPTKFLFLMTLISGTLISVSANSWFGAWIGLEINLLSFIPLMASPNNLLSSEASLKYFLTQALASATLLFIIILSSLMTSFTSSLTSTENPYMTVLISLPLLLKMGAAPFHFWFPGVMEGLNWMNSLILMTWQKIAPLMLLSYNLQMNLYLGVIILLSVLVGSIGGLNQTSLRKILAYSSINHLGWLISAASLGENLWNMYFYMYSFLTCTIIFMLQTFKLFHINQIFSLNSLTPITKFAFFTAFLSLGGLPPFIGFLPKWIIIQSMIEANLIFIVSMMVIMTLITLFYYLRLSFGAFMLTYSETLWSYKNHYYGGNQLLALTLSMVSTLGLTFCSIIYFIL